MAIKPEYIREIRTEPAAALGGREDPFRAFLEATEQGFCIVELLGEPGQPLDYRFVGVNRAFETQTGLADVIGKRMRELRPHHEESWYQRYGEVAESGRSMRFDHIDRALDRHYEVFAFRVGEPGERQVGILFRDISDRKQAELALAENRAQLQSLFDEAPLGIFLVDDELRIRAVNPAALPSAGDIPNLVGSRFEDVIRQIWHDDFADEVVRRFRDTLETGETYRDPERVELRRDSGVQESYEWQISRIPMDGNRYGVVCYFRNISTEVQARQTLADSHRKKDEFIATLSHELRNPLFAVRNAVELLWRICGNQRDARSTLEMLERQAGQITQLMDDLLDVSRLSRGKIELNRKVVELSSVAEGVIETYQPIAADDKHVLTVTVPPEPIYVMADPTRLAQVLGNLLNNALKFTDSGGLVRLIIAREGKEAVIRVQDSGIGMAAEQMTGIFDMFAQVDSSIERMQSGLGIGLTLVKNLVEMHGGRVEAHSAGLGRGSEFTVRLPIEVDQSPEPAPASALSTLADIARRRILVVDDNRDAAQSLTLLLELSGHEVHTAYDGVEAVEAVERLHPDTVFLDIGMPRLNGYDAARAIRERQGDATPVLIALTGYGQEQDRERAEEAGFDAHLVKPADFLSLSRALASMPARSPPGPG